jgi:hypothetical protein
MSSVKPSARRQGKDDSLRVLNLCFFLAVALAAIIVVYAYMSSGRPIMPSEKEMSTSLDGLRAQGQTFYEVTLSKISEFIQWGQNLLAQMYEQ